MDSRSLEIERDGRHVGYIQWHKELEPLITITRAFGFITLTELESVISQYKTHRFGFAKVTSQL